MSYHDLFKFPSRFIYYNSYFNGFFIPVSDFIFLEEFIHLKLWGLFFFILPFFWLPHLFLIYQLMILKICPVSVRGVLFILVSVSSCPLEYLHIMLFLFSVKSPFWVFSFYFSLWIQPFFQVVFVSACHHLSIFSHTYNVLHSLISDFFFCSSPTLLSFPSFHYKIYLFSISLSLPNIFQRILSLTKFWLYPIALWNLQMYLV